MNVLVAIIIVLIGYAAGLHVGKNSVKMSCPGIIKIARDEEDKGYYCALEVKGKDSLKEIYESDTVTFEVRRMSETRIKQGL
nr:MAG TPA: hypothetical protein [Caudoviricetes sp.]